MQARWNHFSTKVKVKNLVLLYNMIRCFSPHPLKSCWLLMQSKTEGTLMQMTNALVKTRHKNKRHMQFPTSAPNFRGFSWPPDPAFPSPMEIFQQYNFHSQRKMLRTFLLWHINTIRTSTSTYVQGGPWNSYIRPSKVLKCCRPRTEHVCEQLSAVHCQRPCEHELNANKK